MKTATPTKLRDGSWGATVKSTSIKTGDTVQITTRGGKSWTARVSRVVWSGNGISICATASLDRPARSSRSSSNYSDVYCGYPCPVTGVRCCEANGQPCHDCL